MYSQLAEWHRRYGTRLTILLYPSDEFRAMLTIRPAWPANAGRVAWFAEAGGSLRPPELIGPVFTRRFGGQELPSAQIPGFVSEYLPLEGEGVHLMAKVAVNGEHADPVWSWLTTGPFPGEVGWNFDAVFLLDAEGVPVGRYSATELERLDGDLGFLVGQSK